MHPSSPVRALRLVFSFLRPGVDHACVFAGSCAACGRRYVTQMPTRRCFSSITSCCFYILRTLFIFVFLLMHMYLFYLKVAYGLIRVANEAMCRPIRNLTTMKVGADQGYAESQRVSGTTAVVL